MDGVDQPPPYRRWIAAMVIATATAQSLGVALRIPTQLTANDISRYCTVWALLERGTYAIDDCPWAKDTQDKVRKPEPFSKLPQPPEHFYSSKPPLFATMMAGVIYPFRKLSGVELDRKFEQKRIERNVEKADPEHPGQTIRVKETPPPVIWPAYILYFKPVIVLFNVVPFCAFLILYVRLLDRYAPNDWAWFVSLFAGAWGNYLVVFNASLNNHTVAAYSAFFSLYALISILEDESARPGRFLQAGFWGGFCCCNEIPAASFGVLLFVCLMIKNPRATLVYFVPAALVPLSAFFATQYLALGQLKPVYEEFGTKAYNYDGAYWQTPLEFDRFNDHPESYPVYLFHMTFGRHGVFSLTPIFLFSILGATWSVAKRDGKLRVPSAITLILTVVLLAFYTVNPKARNYGGSTSGLRWLFWLIPFWLVSLPSGLAWGQSRKWGRGLTLTALAFSVFAAGYALRSPWTHPWIVDALEHLDLFELVR